MSALLVTESGPFSPPVSAGGFSPKMPPQYVVDSSHVFHLLAEGADALELTGRGSKRILVFGHGLGCRHELTLDRGDGVVEHLADGAMFDPFVGLGKCDAAQHGEISHKAGA